jgi:epoxyqueuosine reductase
MLKDRLTAALDAAGYRHRLAPIGIVEELARNLCELREQGLLAESLYERYVRHFVFTPPSEVPEPRTLIVVAFASPAVKVRFHLDSGPLEAVVPPTYVSSAGGARCLAILRSILGPAGHAVERARVPNKLLSARTGLARYGRNNLAYVGGMGTFARLDAYCTDADLQADEPATGSLLMNACETCRDCYDACPTGCIPRDGTVIDARRCLTYLNEGEGKWPDWLDPKAHNSLLGCMRCQESCPVDRRYLGQSEVTVEFDREETEIILRDIPVDQLPDTVLAKLKKLDLEEYSTVLGRNLLALRDAARSAGCPSL